MTKPYLCYEHVWKNDPLFEDETVIMFTSMQGEEMRQTCKQCGAVRYVPNHIKQGDMTHE